MNDYEEYKVILQQSHREGINDLLTYLDSSDFAIAPASTRFHGNFKGGLCKHCINVYHNMLKLNELFSVGLDSESMILVALLHDLAKVNYYEKCIQNRKDYNINGRQSDSAGRFDWVQVETYKVKEALHQDNLFGEHGLNSYMLASKYIHLSGEEAAAIINHHMSLDNGRPRTEISEILNRYPLATILCLADQAAAYLDENPYKVDE